MASESEKYAIRLATCNEILRGMGMEEYQLSVLNEEPALSTIELLKQRQQWVNEDSLG